MKRERIVFTVALFLILVAGILSFNVVPANACRGSGDQGYKPDTPADDLHCDYEVVTETVTVTQPVTSTVTQIVTSTSTQISTVTSQQSTTHTVTSTETVLQSTPPVTTTRTEFITEIIEQTKTMELTKTFQINSTTTLPSEDRTTTIPVTTTLTPATITSTSTVTSMSMTTITVQAEPITTIKGTIKTITVNQTVTNKEPREEKTTIETTTITNSVTIKIYPGPFDVKTNCKFMYKQGYLDYCSDDTPFETWVQQFIKGESNVLVPQVKTVTTTVTYRSFIAATTSNAFDLGPDAIQLFGVRLDMAMFLLFILGIVGTGAMAVAAARNKEAPRNE